MRFVKSSLELGIIWIPYKFLSATRCSGLWKLSVYTACRYTMYVGGFRVRWTGVWVCPSALMWVDVIRDKGSPSDDVNRVNLLQHIPRICVTSCARTNNAWTNGERVWRVAWRLCMGHNRGLPNRFNVLGVRHALFRLQECNVQRQCILFRLQCAETMHS